MLTPAPADEATAFVRSLGLTPGRRIIGVALRGWFHRRGGFLPHKLRSGLKLNRGEGDLEMTRFLARLADVLRSLARREDAAILFMPTYTLSHEGDVAVCRKLELALGDVESRLALIDDPGLYKAVAGKLTLMVSARMHPLIFAASMGVPIVGLAYNRKFEGLFDLLGLPRRFLWLDELASGPHDDRLEQLAISAIEDSTDLRARSAALAEAVSRRTAALLGDATHRAGGAQ
jgi:polysaccharide pyruvyl transferase WcaK-like protein